MHKEDYSELVKRLGEKKIANNFCKTKPWRYVWSEQSCSHSCYLMTSAKYIARKIRLQVCSQLIEDITCIQATKRKEECSQVCENTSKTWMYLLMLILPLSI